MQLSCVCQSANRSNRRKEAYFLLIQARKLLRSAPYSHAAAEEFSEIRRNSPAKKRRKTEERELPEWA